MTYQHKDFGGYLRWLRESHSYTQEFLASVLGFDSYSSYGKYEKGQSKLHLEQAIQLAELYGLSIEQFSSMGKESSATVAEEAEIYSKKKRVSIVLELDGKLATLQQQIEMITKVNAALAG